MIVIISLPGEGWQSIVNTLYVSLCICASEHSIKENGLSGENWVLMKKLDSREKMGISGERKRLKTKTKLVDHIVIKSCNMKPLVSNTPNCPRASMSRW